MKCGLAWGNAGSTFYILCNTRWKYNLHYTTNTLYTIRQIQFARSYESAAQQWHRLLTHPLCATEHQLNGERRRQMYGNRRHDEGSRRSEWPVDEWLWLLAALGLSQTTTNVLSMFNSQCSQCSMFNIPCFQRYANNVLIFHYTLTASWHCAKAHINHYLD